VNQITTQELCIIHALVEVKKDRGMSAYLALKEAMIQRENPRELTADYLDDLYKASCILYKEFEWFRNGTSETLAILQAGKQEE